MAKEYQEKQPKQKDAKQLYKMKVSKITLAPYNWLKTAKIYNKIHEEISYQWFENNADIVVAFFNQKGVNFKGLVEKFYETYEDAKTVNLPIEVINIPLDNSRQDFQESLETQANWFTLKFNDELISILVYMYGVTCIPHLMVFTVDGNVISSNGFLDFEEYGRNVLITWLASSSSNKTHRRLSKETVYGPVWRYISSDNEDKKINYSRKFEVGECSSTSYSKKD